MAQLIRKNFRTVSLPSELLGKVEDKIKEKNSTFHTKTDFVTYAIRKELEGRAI